MKKIKLTITCLLFITAATVISCRKSADNSVNPSSTSDNDVSGSNRMALAENTSNDAVQIGAEALDNHGTPNDFRLSSTEQYESLTHCASIDSSTPGIIIVLFSGDTCMDGRVRTGSIKYDFSASPAGAHYRTPGFSCVVTSNNYSVDGNAVTISHTIFNSTVAGFDPKNTNETWNITGSIQILTVDGDTISWSCTRTKELLNTADANVYRGEALPIRWNLARVGLTGNASGRRANGETFTIVVNTQLVRDFGSCRVGGRKVPFILGTLTYTASNRKYPRYIDYGAPNGGDCDMKANVTINGKTFLVTLP